MHTFNADSVTFRHNGDYYGEIILTVDEKAVEDALAGKKFVTIEFSALRSFFAEYLRRRTIENIEAMSDEQIEAWATIGNED